MERNYMKQNFRSLPYEKPHKSSSIPSSTNGFPHSQWKETTRLRKLPNKWHCHHLCYILDDNENRCNSKATPTNHFHASRPFTFQINRHMTFVRITSTFKRNPLINCVLINFECAWTRGLKVVDVVVLFTR